MKPEFNVVPMLSIHPDKINVYNQVVWNPYRPSRNPGDRLKGVSNLHNGKVSVSARRKINKAIKYLLFLANDKILPDTAHGKAYKFKLAFITLTLPSAQIHSDNEIKSSCLNQFLIELRHKWSVRNYIWRAEKQKNGNLHFHILVDRFVPWSELRDNWNRIVNKLGYVDRYRDQMRAFHEGGFRLRSEMLEKWDYKSQVRAYKKGKANDWRSPNSTDVHSVVKIRNIEAYISKYVTKDEQTKGLEGRLWGCNKELSNIPGGRIVIDSQVNDALNSLFEKYNPKAYYGDHFSTFYINLDMLQDSDSTVLFKAFAAFLSDHFNFNLQTKLVPI